MSFTLIDVSVVPPVGSIVAYAGTSSPNGWLLCDGSSYSTTTYSSLYNVIGNKYGSATNTFNVPDLRSKVIRGSSATATLTNTTNGANTVTLATSNMPSHTHTYNDAYYGNDTGSKPNGSIFGTGGNVDTNNGFIWRQSNGTWGTSASDINTGSTGSGTAFSIIPSNLEMNFIIKI